MPTTIVSIAASLKVFVHGPVSWGSCIPSSRSGVYIIAVRSPVIGPVFDTNAIDDWIRTTPRLTLSGKNHSSICAQDLCAEMLKFWIPDEMIVYVGRAKVLKRRIYQFYGTPLGARRPHKGGYWIKTLASLCSLDIYWIESQNEKVLEKDVVEFFSRNVTPAFKNHNIFRLNEYLPFANLQMPGGGNKKHKIVHP